MADWRELEGAVDRIASRVFGERIRLSFFNDFKPDPNRPAIEIGAIVHFGGADSFAPGEGFRTRLNDNEGEVFIDRSTYTGPIPRRDDYVDCLDREGQPYYRVKQVSSAYSNLLVLELSQ